MSDAEHSLAGLTDNARDHLGKALDEYKEKLLREAKAIEQLEHTGHGPAEITAAHVEEARWVTIRRMRRSVKSGWLVSLSRIIQYIAAILAGIGGSNLAETWGVIMAMAAVAIGCGFFMVERQMIWGQ